MAGFNVPGSFTKALLVYKPFADEAIKGDSGKSSGWFTDPEPDPNKANTKATTTTASEEDSTWGILRWTAMLKEGHSVANEVTSYPVGTGFKISNHVIKKNRILQLQGIVCNVTMANSLFDPLTAIPQIGGAIMGSGAGTALASALNLGRNFLTGDEASTNVVKSAFETLQKLCLEGRFVHVTTILGTYVNCIIRSVECEQDEQTSSILAVKVVLEEIQVVGLTRNDKEILTFLEDKSKDEFEWQKYVSAVGLGSIGMIF